jgi:hypothetical protein
MLPTQSAFVAKYTCTRSVEPDAAAHVRHLLGTALFADAYAKSHLARLEAAPSDSAKAHSFARSGASTQSALACCCVCRRAFSNGSACYADQTKVKLKRFHLWRPAALDGVEAQTVPGFASLGETAKEAVRAWLQGAGGTMAAPRGVRTPGMADGDYSCSSSAHR